MSRTEPSVPACVCVCVCVGGRGMWVSRRVKSQVLSVHRTSCGQRGQLKRQVSSSRPTCNPGGAESAQARGLAASAQAVPLTCGRKPGRSRGLRSVWDGSAGSVEPEGSGSQARRLCVPAGEVSWPGKVQLCAAIPGMSGRRL